MSKKNSEGHMVHIEGDNIIIQGEIQRISLNLSEGKSLVQELIRATHVLTSLEEKKQNHIDSIHQKLRTLQKDQDLTERQSIIHSWNEGYLCSASSAVLASMFRLDKDGWACLEDQLTRHGAVGLLLALAQHQEEDVLSALWSWGSFDFLLHDSLWDVPPEQVPYALHMRVMPFLCQECYIPAGEFVMGSDGIDALPCETPMRTVERTKNIYMTRFPVTQLQYWILTGENPSHHNGALRPVDSVSWIEAVELCNRYSEAMGLKPAYRIDGEWVHWDQAADGYRLPTEAEWECGAKAWEQSIFSGDNNPDEVAWFAENSEGRSHKVGSKKPNAANLYDMGGNVWEWVFDFYSEFAYTSTGTVDPVVWEGKYRVCRGGGYTSSIDSLRNTIRGAYEAEVRSPALGFRMVRTVM